MTEIEVPYHYSRNAKQPLDFMSEYLTSEAYEGFMVGNCIKYLMRYNFKDGIKDLYKARDYVQKLIDFKESNTTIDDEKDKNDEINNVSETKRKLVLNTA